MVKKLILAFICIISICSISNAKEVTHVSRSDTSQGVYSLFLDYDDNTSEIINFNNVYDMNAYYYELAIQYDLQDTGVSLQMSPKQINRLHQDVMREAAINTPKIPSSITVVDDNNDDSNNNKQSKEEKTINGILDLLF